MKCELKQPNNLDSSLFYIYFEPGSSTGSVTYLLMIELKRSIKKAITTGVITTGQIKRGHVDVANFFQGLIFDS
ncbi:hypothetical protein LOAG_14166 [Loa loa]|uniref:Uncharacterized protein n=1 Tax=Loa loa TaxID=7209 RepID=A0A1S0TI96_LOALO|nr:hypothetical protein LOAG_14166 [Loa loa]EFO14356.1 hypothetical protein LOAG_14166 [Loa loa]